MKHDRRRHERTQADHLDLAYWQQQRTAKRANAGLLALHNLHAVRAIFRAYAVPGREPEKTGR